MIQGLFSSVAKRRMTNVVGEGQGFREIGVESQGAGERTCSLSDLEGVGEAAAEMIARRKAGQASENLRLASQPAEGARVQNAGAVPRKRGAIQVRRFRMGSLREGTFGIDGNSRRQQAKLLGFRSHHHSFCDPTSVIPHSRWKRCKGTMLVR
jgi:hypothetical protein